MTSSKSFRLRAFWVQVHLWLGLTLGVVGVLIGLSGSILVYDHEIDAWLNPQRYAISGTAGRAAAMPSTRSAPKQALGKDARARPASAFPTRRPGPVMVFARAEATRAVPARLPRSADRRRARHRVGPRSGWAGCTAFTNR